MWTWVVRARIDVVEFSETDQLRLAGAAADLPLGSEPHPALDRDIFLGGDKEKHHPPLDGARYLGVGKGRRCAEHRVELGVVAAGVRNSASRGIGLRVGWAEDSVKLADYGDCRAISVPDFGPQAGDGESLPDGVA